jgi:hypothetical protein
LSSAATPECENLAYSRAYETHALREAVGALKEADTYALKEPVSPLFKGTCNACSQGGSR